MREDFCAFILTHGRPHKVHTYRTLKNYGYTGRVFIVIDDEDADGGEYRRIYGQDVLVFSKDEVGSIWTSLIILRIGGVSHGQEMHAGIWRSKRAIAISFSLTMTIMLGVIADGVNITD